MTKWKLVPVEPSEHQWNGLARDIISGWEMGCKKPRDMFAHLEMILAEIPQWLRDEQEMGNLDHVPSKGTRAAIIYRAMLEAAPQPPKLSDEQILEIATRFQVGGNFDWDTNMCEREQLEFARAIEREILGGGHE